MPDDPRKKAKSSPYIPSKPPDKSQTYVPSQQDEPTASGPAQPARPASTPDVKPVVPGYHLHRVLGEGGMGVVYLATHVELRRQVALKTLLVKYAANEMATKRFFAEAQIVASLRHPHIVEVYDFGQADQAQFLTMEYLTGGTLADRMKNDPRMDARSAAKLLLQIATGVGYAHEQGVIHRDLKPSNILFTADKSLHVEDKKAHGSTLRSATGAIPKVTDFGLAKRGDTGMTATEATLGTPAYMAPEQAKKAKFVGPPADVWALGAILYEALTGCRPFPGDTAMAILMALHETEPIPLRKIVPTIPHDLETICLKCLSKNPDARYDTATELADDLRRWLEGEPIDARRVTAVERAYLWVKRKPAFVSAVLLGVAGTIVAGLAVTTFIALRQSIHTGDQLALEKKESEDARDREAKSRQVAEVEKAAAETARDQTRAEQQKSEALRKEAEEARKAAEAARDKVVTAQAAEAKANQEAARVRDAQVAREYGRNVQLALQSYHRHDANAAKAMLDASPPAQRGWEWRYVHRLCNAELLTLSGHTGRLTAGAFRPDGTAVATAGADSTVKVWDAKTGKLQATLADHRREITSLAYHPDGTKLATASRDRTAKVWDVAAGRTLVSLLGHGGWVTAVAYSPDGARLVTGSADNTARVWDGNGTTLFTLRGHTREITAVAFSPDGSKVATASSDETAKVWDAKTGAELRTCSGHADRVISIAFTPDGTQVVTGSADGTVKFTDARTGLVLHTLDFSVGALTAVALRRDGTRLLTATADKTAKYWEWYDDWSGVRELATLQGHAAPVNAVAWSADGTRILTVGEDAVARIWSESLRTEEKKSADQFVPPPKSRDAAGRLAPAPAVKYDAESQKTVFPAVSPDGGRVVLPEGNNGSSAIVWDVRTGQAALTLKGHTMTVTSAAFNPTGTRIVTTSADMTAKLWDAGTGELLGTTRYHKAAVVAAAFSPDGARLLTASTDAIVSNTENADFLAALSRGRGAVTAVAYSPKADVIVTAGTEGTAFVWGLEETLTPGYPRWRLAGPVGGHKDRITAVAFHPDGLHFVTASDDRTAKVWNLKALGDGLTLKGHARGLVSARYSADGTRIVTAAADGTAKVWDAKGVEFLTLKGNPTGLVAAGFSPDGAHVLLVHDGGKVRAFDAKAGAELTITPAPPSPQPATVTERPIELTSPDGKLYLAGDGSDTMTVFGGARLGSLKKGSVRCAAFSPDSALLATADKDGRVRVWNPKTGAERATLKGHTAAVRSIVFSPDGKAVLTTSDDRTAKLWDTAAGAERQTFAGHAAGVEAGAVAADGSAVATGGADGVGIVWDTATGKARATLAVRHAKTITALAFSPDGTRLVTTSADETARIWDAKSGQEVCALRGHQSAVIGAAFSPDGMRVVTADAEWWVKVWNPTTGTETLSFPNRYGYILNAPRIGFSPDGSRLAVNDRVWDAGPPAGK